MPTDASHGIRGLARDLLQAQPRTAAATVMLVVVQAVTQAFSITLLVPLLGLVGVGGTSSPGLEAAFEAVGLAPTLPVVLGLFVAANLVGITVTVAHERLAARLHHDAVDRSRRTLLGGLERAEWSTLAALDRPRLASALTLDAERIGVAVQFLVLLVAHGAVALVYVGWALATQPWLTLLVGVLAAGLLVAQRPAARAAQRLGRELGESLVAMLHATSAWLQGMKTLRFLPAPPVATERVRSLQMQAQLRRSGSRGVFEAGAIVVLAVAVALAVGPFGLATGTLLFLLYLYARLLPLTSRVLVDAQTLRHATPAFDEHQALAARLGSAAEATAGPVPRLDEALVLDRVVVQHEGGRRVGPVSLVVPNGHLVVLRGPSGSGKTTALDAAAGLFAPVEGRVLLDGVELTDRAAWRHAVAYVPQEPFLLDATVAENLAWMAPSADAVQRLRVLERLAPDVDPDAPVGERGSRLSGGQRRRVALAMALLRRPQLLVVDEPTSELDPQAAAKVLDAIASLAGSTTVLVATHGEAPAGATVVAWPGSALKAEEA